MFKLQIIIISINSAFNYSCFQDCLPVSSEFNFETVFKGPSIKRVTLRGKGV